MKTIYFARHGECEANVQRLIAGTSNNSPLTQLGREQAGKTAEELKDKTIDLIVTSPLDRAQETARRISDIIDYKGEIKIEGLLLERDFGSASGMPAKEGFELIDSGKINDLETTEHLAERMQQALDWFKTLPGKYILAVGHAGAEQMMRTIYEGRQPVTFLETEHLKNGHIREYQVDSAVEA